MPVFARRYACPFRTKHRTYVREAGYVREEFWCTLTHEPCRYLPSRCPVRRRMENRGLEEWIS